MKQDTLVQIANAAYNAVNKEEASEIFQKSIQTLPTDQQRIIADEIENRFGQDIPANWEGRNGEAMAAFLQAASPAALEDFSSVAYPLGQAQARAFLMNEVVQIKGQDTNSSVKTYLEKISEMTDQQFNSGAAHFTVLLALPPAATSAPPPNPYRKGLAPKP